MVYKPINNESAYTTAQRLFERESNLTLVTGSVRCGAEVKEVELPASRIEKGSPFCKDCKSYMRMETFYHLDYFTYKK